MARHTRLVRKLRARRREYEPFIIPPVLFGWEDLDGDRVPEISSKTPYGRAR